MLKERNDMMLGWESGLFLAQKSTTFNSNTLFFFFLFPLSYCTVVSCTGPKNDAVHLLRTFF